MKNMKIYHRSIKVSLVFALTFILAASAHQQVYVVYLGMNDGSRTEQEIESHHHSYLHAVKGSLQEAKSSVVYSYTKAIDGFAAFLSPQEADAISEMDGVISVLEDEVQELHTSRSWDFASLLESDWDPTEADGLEDLMEEAEYGEDIIIGVIDSGIWPESLSFSDKEMDRPPPPSWKGTCQTGEQFNLSNCNNKLIGARYFKSGYEARYGPIDQAGLDFQSARDFNGHGTHVTSIAVGQRVIVSGGYGMGIVRGGADLGRISVYKVCWEGSACLNSDILAAFNFAISDGVHVLSVSMGVGKPMPHNQDIFAIGSFGAMRNNIVVSFSAGNSGPARETVNNIAPWAITTGASTTDREFVSPALFGNGYEAKGRSITPFMKQTFPLVFAGDIEYENSTSPGSCSPYSLSPLAIGKAVFCIGGDSGSAFEVQSAGGVAAVLQNPYIGYGVEVKPFSIPTTVVFEHETIAILSYIRSTSTPTVALTPGNTTFNRPAPFMAPLSSRGPVPIEPHILKPDVIAPGLNIFAADLNEIYAFKSGTSMACAHVSGVAALLKAIHPTWSQAAIRSAIMTTGKVTDNTGHTIPDELYYAASPFEYGSGHIQPSKAADPGLVYDSTYDDYNLFLCSSIGFSLDKTFMCPPKSNPPNYLNYPSIAIPNAATPQQIPRKVTNVGNPISSYNVTIDAPPGYNVQISPPTLAFRQIGETLPFNVSVEARSDVMRNLYVFGSYTWSDGVHEVRSRIVVRTLSHIMTDDGVDVELHANA